MQMRSIARLCFAAAAALTAPASALASAWTRADGDLFLLSRVDYFRANDMGTQFRRLDSTLYVEYGVFDGVAVGGKAAYGSSWLVGEIATNVGTGFSELEGFAQARLHSGRNDTLSVRLAAGSANRLSTGARPGLASDGLDLDGRLLYGRTLTEGPVKLFAAFEAGYRRRFGTAADELRADGLIGLEVGDRWLALVESFNTVSMSNEDPGGAEFDIYKVQPSIVWRFSRRLALQAGATFEVAGRNVATGRTLSLGLWTEF